MSKVLNGVEYTSESQYAHALHDEYERLHRAVVAGLRDEDDGELASVTNQLRDMGYEVFEFAA